MAMLWTYLQKCKLYHINISMLKIRSKFITWPDKQQYQEALRRLTVTIYTQADWSQMEYDTCKRYPLVQMPFFPLLLLSFSH